jgi:hypothetical protein
MTMGPRPGLATVIGGALVALAVTFTVVAAPQPTAQAPEPLTALLTEVHALRLAMEQAATLAPRVQLTLARLNIEEQRIALLAGQLDQVRREMSAASLEGQKLADRIPEIEKGLQTAADPQTRRSWEYEQENVKRQVAAQARLEQRLRERENEAAQALSTEQARWVDLNARLDELERLLGPAPR